MAIKFSKRAPTRHEKCPAAGALASWLFLMQHYGLPTRLLDWTESPLLAVFFSVWQEKYDAEDATLWALDPYALNYFTIKEHGLVQPGHPQADRLVQLAYSQTPADEEAVVSLLTEEIDVRMLTQLSGFTIHGSPTALEGRPGLESILFKYQIPAAAKPQIRRQLTSLGIRERNVFPDLEHLANDLAHDEY